MKLFSSKEERKLQANKKELLKIISNEIKKLDSEPYFVEWSRKELTNILSAVDKVQTSAEFYDAVRLYKGYCVRKAQKGLRLQIDGALMNMRQKGSDLIDDKWAVEELSSMREEIDNCTDMGKLADYNNRFYELGKIILGQILKVQKENLLNKVLSFLNFANDNVAVAYGIENERKEMLEQAAVIATCDSMEELDVISAKVFSLYESFAAKTKKGTEELTDIVDDMFTSKGPIKVDSFSFDRIALFLEIQKLEMVRNSVYDYESVSRLRVLARKVERVTTAEELEECEEVFRAISNNEELGKLDIFEKFEKMSILLDSGYFDEYSPKK